MVQREKIIEERLLGAVNERPETLEIKDSSPSDCVGVIIGSVFSVIIWLFLITMH
jgi:hypothetical protein